MINKVRAAPDGARRPCSQSCNVRTDTPKTEAKRACDKPVFSRIEDIFGTIDYTAGFAALNFPQTGKNFAPDIFASLHLAIIYFLLDLPKDDVRGNVFRNILRVHG